MSIVMSENANSRSYVLTIAGMVLRVPCCLIASPPMPRVDDWLGHGHCLASCWTRRRLVPVPKPEHQSNLQLPMPCVDDRLGKGHCLASCWTRRRLVPVPKPELIKPPTFTTLASSERQRNRLPSVLKWCMTAIARTVSAYINFG